VQKYLNKSIKEIITEFPDATVILAEYGIGCGPCNVGTCLFKDIVQIHQLPAEKEQEMMERIVDVIRNAIAAIPKSA